MMSRKRTIGIIGLGPVGTILAAHLANGGMDMVVEDIAEGVLANIEKDGLRVSGIRELSIKVGKTARSMAELAEFEPDMVFVATKACFLKPVLNELKPVYETGMKVVSFQNGLDNEQMIAKSLGVDASYRVVVNYAGNLETPGHARMNWFQPPNYVGAFKDGRYTTDETTRDIAEVLTTCGLKTEGASDIKKHVWMKSILNAALCSVCALTRQTMKRAMDFGSSRDLAVKVLEEGLKVAERDGYDFGEDAIEQFTEYLEKGGMHKPSMLVDVENGRKTEVDFLSGAIVGYGEKYGVETPVNMALTSLLKALENRYLREKS